MDFVKRANEALTVNPNIFRYPLRADIGIDTHGSNWYWAVTAVMAFSTIVFIAMSMRLHRRDRVFHYITAAITLVAAIAYFTMASNLGYAAIQVEFARSDRQVSGATREIFYVRYIDWVVTTPLLLLDLLLTAGLPWPTILYTLFLDEVMIITGLVGALVPSSYKWGYFVFAMLSLFGVAWNVMLVGRAHARVLGMHVSKTFVMCGVWTMALWFIYPIAWGLSEGGNVIGSDAEAVFYGVLDILAKPCFGALLLWGHRNIDPASLGLAIRDYEDEIPGPTEKRGLGRNGVHNGVHNGVSNGVHNGGETYPTATNGVNNTNGLHNGGGPSPATTAGINNTNVGAGEHVPVHDHATTGNYNQAV